MMTRPLSRSAHRTSVPRLAMAASILASVLLVSGIITPGAASPLR